MKFSGTPDELMKCIVEPLMSNKIYSGTLDDLMKDTVEALTS